MDVQAIARVHMTHMKHFLTRFADHRIVASMTRSDEDMAELNRLVAKLPSEPDEKLR
jgi:hypothetical protein